MTQPHEMRLQAVMPAPLEAVHTALTDPAALRIWLAEHAEVALPERYEFWGRYTPDGAEPHQRLLHVDERSLRLAWTVDGVETTVSFELAEDESGTLLTLSQSDLPSFAEILSDTAGPRGELQTFWLLAIENLADHLSGRELTPTCDLTSPELRASLVIDATPEAVFDSLTIPEQFSTWSGAHIDIEPYVGGRYAMGGFDLNPGGVTFVEFEPGRKATLRFADGLTETWELADSDGKTSSCHPPREGSTAMASLVLKMSVSLDGYVAPLDGSTDWVAAGRSDDGARWTAETVSNAGTHLMGAATYAGWAGYWPSASGPFAQPMNEIPKVVFSNSLTSADWADTTIAAGDLTDAVTRLKQERPDGYLLAHGGVRFAQSLVETGLIDEYRLVTHPVVLGAGERLFRTPLTLEPISTIVFSAGAVAHVFTAHP